MNNLGRDIQEGEQVVLAFPYWKGTEEERTVTVTDGYGMYASLRGSALYVTFPDGEKTRAEGYEIDKEATEALQQGYEPLIEEGTMGRQEKKAQEGDANYAEWAERWLADKEEDLEEAFQLLTSTHGEYFDILYYIWLDKYGDEWMPGYESGETEGDYYDRALYDKVEEWLDRRRSASMERQEKKAQATPHRITEQGMTATKAVDSVLAALDFFDDAPQAHEDIETVMSEQSDKWNAAQALSGLEEEGAIDTSSGRVDIPFAEDLGVDEHRIAELVSLGWLSTGGEEEEVTEEVTESKQVGLRNPIADQFFNQRGSRDA